MNVSIGADDPATTVTVDVDGVAQTNSGTYILLTQQMILIPIRLARLFP